MRRKLAAQRLTTPLFDIAGSTRNIEAAYTIMHERAQAGLPPDHITELECAVRAIADR